MSESPRPYRYPYTIMVDASDLEPRPDPFAIIWAARFRPATCSACRHEVEAHRVMDVCIIDDCNCQEEL